MVIYNILLFTGIIFGIAIISVRCKALHDQERSLGTPELGVCTTMECNKTALRILNKMDLKASICDNFYTFACGNFLNITDIPNNKTTVNSFGNVDDNIKKLLHKSIQEILPNATKPFQLVKILYQDCMNTAAIENQGLEPLRNILNQVGEWPLLHSDWKSDTWDWKNITYKVHELGCSTNYFIRFRIKFDATNNSRRIIDLSAADLGILRRHAVEGVGNEVIQAYKKFMVAITVLLKKDVNKARVDEALLESVKFEIKLSTIQRREILLNNPMTVGELTATYPSIPWLEYINKLLAPHARINETEIVNVAEPTYLAAVEKLLRTTPNHVLANYVFYRLVSGLVDYLNQEARQEWLKFLTKLSGKSQYDDRWYECIDVVLNSKLYLGASSIYVRKNFNEETKKTATEIFNNIRKQFRMTIEQGGFMDKETQAKALVKLDAMGNFIGYPDELLDDEKLKDYYAPLNLTPGHYLQNILNMRLFDTARAIEWFTKPGNKSNWVLMGNVATANAYYTTSLNYLSIPAGILQGEFINKDRPKYMNYGTIGFIIGHELIHGFDSKGRKYDEHGNLVNWWKKETEKSFLEKAKCLIDQYGNYIDQNVGLKLRGIRTQSENIADNAGIKYAYRAYQQSVKDNGEDARLPGLHYTTQQLFWISAASFWCSKDRLEKLNDIILTNAHSPAKFRVVGAMSNMPEFANDFQCSPNSQMNPKKRCSVW